ncbi:MAG: DinB family protein [Bacteroidia bacterium]|nr:DinB family protein [Bacteroidia bacterium]
MEKIIRQLNELEARIPDCDKINPAVSAASVGWHIEHVLLATGKVIDAVSASDPGMYKWKFNKNRLIVFFLNKIPRGKGRAPKPSVPKGETTRESLTESLEKTRSRVPKLSGLQPNHYFDHPVFGKINRKQTLKFLKMHLEHHLKIIREIVR